MLDWGRILEIKGILIDTKNSITISDLTICEGSNEIKLRFHEIFLGSHNLQVFLADSGFCEISVSLANI